MTLKNITGSQSLYLVTKYIIWT